MQNKEFKIEGMSCQHCVMAVKKELSSLALESADVEIGKAKVQYDESKVTEEQIKRAIEEAGYKVVEN
ncbi:heavy-metal-associated domain-containing protein [Melioribacter sp. Ez-97]|jgi:copper ion binding protein|uniref:heavy-metal-associated domain-containing protein n=1 Tax=Melioribacter sp. Ez-97 TaxID=3423434 RepID=UPI003EDAF32E